MLRVCAIQQSEEGKFQDPDSIVHIHRVAEEYIPKREVLRVLKFNNVDDFRIMTRFCHDNVSNMHLMMRSVFDMDNAPACTGDGTPNCACFETVLPVYAVVIASKEETKNSRNRVPCLLYLIHPLEREKMERFIDGTDDPMWDYVHQLRYGPPDDSSLVRLRTSQDAQRHFQQQQDQEEEERGNGKKRLRTLDQSKGEGQT